MFQNRILLISLSVITLLAGCIVPGARREREEIALQKNDSLFVVDEGDYHFRIALPKDLLISNQPRITLDAHNHCLRISCGREFHLLVTAAEMTHTAAPTDGIFTHRIMDNEDNSCIYKRVLPDGSTYDFGLHQQAVIGDTQYAFQSAPEGEFSLQDILRMKMALASIKL